MYIFFSSGIEGGSLLLSNSEASKGAGRARFAGRLTSSRGRVSDCVMVLVGQKKRVEKYAKIRRCMWGCPIL